MSSTIANARREESLHQAREVGRREAEDFVLRLERREQQEREGRLAELAWRPRLVGERWSNGESSPEVVQLKARVQDLSSYLHAVENSWAWRLIQALRRPFGRAW